ncbi:MBL fold metallo-hydrolase [bacterium]
MNRKTILTFFLFIFCISNLSTLDLFNRIKIYWLGYSCFYIESPAGLKILMDPLSESLGYDMPNLVMPDIVTISNERFEHNNMSFVGGRPRIIKDKVYEKIGDVVIKAIETETKESETAGSNKKNMMYLFEIGGLRVVHIGALGHILTKKQYKKIGKVDILIVNINDKYAINYLQAYDMCRKIKPRIILPMGFKKEILKGVDNILRKFLNSFENAAFQNFVYLNKQEIRENNMQVLVLGVMNKLFE